MRPLIQIQRRFAAKLGLFALLLCLSASCRASAGQKVGASVALCHGVTLEASYLFQTGPGEGEGFEFSLTNGTSRPIRLTEPVPSSSHWYALSHGKWLWRASSGAGGSLLDATNESGRVAVYPSAPKSVPERTLVVPPHATKKWVSSERENPVLEYKPGCPICSYPGEREYRVVFAYAYLPNGGDKAELLRCGLRSKPVPMPPKR